MTTKTTSQPFLIIQIPCLNEEHTLPQTIADLPTRIDGIGKIEYLVIDDGSTDRTAEVAKNLKVHHLIKNQTTIGLARSFRKGLDNCLALGADIIVNTDGDNQYSGMDIAKLVVPIIEDRAEIVVGDRNTADMEHFSVFKRLLQKIGSLTVQRLSGLDIPDAVSGFRAISRAAALQINIVSSFSYTAEMLIQAGNKQLSVVSVPIKTNSATRKSRLFRSIPQFLQRQITTMIRMYAMYRPLRVFSWLGSLLIWLVPYPFSDLYISICLAKLLVIFNLWSLAALFSPWVSSRCS